uniref:Plus3 domain-containing protein n=1 Tax=Panagrellus redivivus TaxID=6233 RepID=A0A7E4V2I8_PANRE
MSDGNSPADLDPNFVFSDDEDMRRPRRAAANRQTFVESGTDDDDEATPGSKRKAAKRPKKSAKRPRRSSSSGSGSSSDEEDDEGMKNLTEKERELEIFKHIERQEMMKTRKEIQQKLMGGEPSESRPSKAPKAAPAPKPTSKPERESGEESSSNDEAEPEGPKSPSPMAPVKRVIEDPESEESEIELDTEYHRPSDVAKKIETKQALNNLVKSRKEKQKNEEKRNILDVDKVFGGGERSSSEDSSSSDDSSESDSEDSDNEGGRRASPEIKGENVSHHDQLNEIRLSRFKLAKMCHAPFFDKSILGCFVRINVGQVRGDPVYRAAQIIAVVESSKQYVLEDTKTDKAIRLKHGLDERVYRCNYVSNQPITENEFAKWKHAMEVDRLPMPTTEYIQKKYNDIQAALNYEYSDADVRKMVEQKQKFIRIPGNLAAHKAELLKLKLDADQNGDLERGATLQAEIDELTAAIEEKERERTQGSLAIAFINQRNKEAQMKALAEKAARGGDDNKDDDPFTRKSAKMRVVSGRAKNAAGASASANPAEGESSQTPIPKPTLKPSGSGMIHSSSAPQLHVNRALILGTAAAQQAPKPSLPKALTSSAGASSSNGSPAEGKISFAEYRRRKAAEAAGQK